MVNHLSTSLNLTFSALSDPTRRAILEHLAHGETSVTTLAQPFGISLPAISKHLRVLEKASLVSRRKEGRVHVLRLEAAPIETAAEWMAFYQRFWGERLDDLADHLARSENE